MGNRLVTIDMGRKVGDAEALSLGELGLHLTQCRPGGPWSTSVPSGILIHPAIWPQQTPAENLGGVPPFQGELGPHVT